MAENNILQERLQTACRKWNLTGISSVYEREHDGVYRAVSAEFGPVILKIKTRSDDTALSGEFRALTEMKEKGCCQVYAFDRANGLLLEERIFPGTALNQEPDWERRLLSFAQVFESIHVVPENAASYPSYLDWVRNACKSVTDQGNRELSEGMHLAVKIAVEMFAKYQERMLLHGDLHHENILRNESGNYSIIDPKGVVGPLVFDIPRFVLNELDDRDDSLRKVHIDRVIERLSHLLKYPASDLCRLFFMEVMLANAWCFEDGEEIEEKDVLFAWEMVKEHLSRE